MLIKWADDLQRDLEALNALLARPGLPAQKRRRIEDEIRFVRAGIQGESEAAYEIESAFSRSAVIHGLRLQVAGRVAQIDHLIITRVLHVWVCETKHFAQGVEVNEQGEWTRFWNGERIGMESPVEQNRGQVDVLSEAFRQGLVALPKRLGVRLQPTVEGFVLISSKAGIRRPWGATEHGLDRVIKVDQLANRIDREIETASAARTLRDGAKLVSERTLEELGWQIAALHKPRDVDWAARFGLGKEAAVTAPKEVVVRCASCERAVKPGEIDYCQDKREQFAGRILCYACQHGRVEQRLGL